MSTFTVTGAFGYSGSYIARRLLVAGHTVRTLTRSQGRAHDFGGRAGAGIVLLDVRRQRQI